MADSQPVIAKLADGTEMQFPAGTSTDVVQATVKKHLASSGAPAGGASGSWEPSQPTIGQRVAEIGTAPARASNAVATGFAKSVGQDVSTVAKGINKIPGVGETLAPKEGIAALDKMTQTHGVGEKVGEGVENIAEFAAGGEVVDALAAALKVKNMVAVAKIIQAHPELANVAREGLKGFTVGAAQSALHGEAHPVKEGAETAIMGTLGELGAMGLGKISKAAMPKAAEAVNRHIGLMKSDLDQWSRLKPGSSEAIGKAVLDNVPIKGNLAEQHAAIEATRDSINNETQRVLKSVPARTIPIDSLLTDARNSVAKEIRNQGTDYMGRTASLDAQVDDMRKLLFGKAAVNPHVNVDTALTIRRNLRPNFKNAAMNTLPNVNDMLHTQLYESMNDAIESALPKDAAKTFVDNNALQHKLIIARDAAGEKLNKIGSKSGVASKTASMAVGAAGGAAIGAAGGAVYGHPWEGAAAGAMAGAGIGHGKIDVNLPRADVATQRAIAKVAPKLATLARKGSAPATRVLQAITAVHGGGSGALAGQQ